MNPDDGAREAWVRHFNGNEDLADHPDQALHWTFFVAGWRAAQTRPPRPATPSSPPGEPEHAPEP